MGNQTLESLRLRYVNSAETMRVVKGAVPIIRVALVPLRSDGEVYLPLRQGGGSSELTFFSMDQPRGKPLSEVMQTLLTQADIKTSEAKDVFFLSVEDLFVPATPEDDRSIDFHCVLQIYAVRVGLEYTPPMFGEEFQAGLWVNLKFLEFNRSSSVQLRILKKLLEVGAFGKWP